MMIRSVPQESISGPVKEVRRSAPSATAHTCPARTASISRRSALAWLFVPSVMGRRLSHRRLGRGERHPLVRG
jgi:hypothetical protein